MTNYNCRFLLFFRRKCLLCFYWDDVRKAGVSAFWVCLPYITEVFILFCPPSALFWIISLSCWSDSQFKVLTLKMTTERAVLVVLCALLPAAVIVIYHFCGRVAFLKHRHPCCEYYHYHYRSCWCYRICMHRKTNT